MRKDSSSSNNANNKLILQVLISTMNQTHPAELVSNMKVGSHVLINQITKDIAIPKDSLNQFSTIVSVKDRGLSKSRNMAINHSSANVCVIADDDLEYVVDYEKVIAEGYEKYPDADIIAFYVDTEDLRQRKKMLREGRLNMLNTMKIASWNITFRRKSLVNSGIKFDENFGTGTDNYMGEENIMLFDCYKKGLKIYYIPNKIATIKNSESTWFTGYDKKFFIVKGKVFYRMAPILSIPLAIQYAVRKKSLYDHEINLIKATLFMLLGIFSVFFRMNIQHR